MSAPSTLHVLVCYLSVGANLDVAWVELLDLTSPNPLKSTKSRNSTRQNGPVCAIAAHKDKCFSPEVGYADAVRTPTLIFSERPSLAILDSKETSVLLLTIPTNAIWNNNNGC
uniref:Secreted protein n=1 Tax=Glossina palpalis gambiensis TaxID=67801 RepID=A0A1B0BNQ6_9MUSC